MNPPHTAKGPARDPQGTEFPPSIHAGTAPSVTPSLLSPLTLDGPENLLNLPIFVVADDEQGDDGDDDSISSTRKLHNVRAAQPFLPLSMVPITPRTLQDRMSLPLFEFARSPYTRVQLPPVNETTYDVAGPFADLRSIIAAHDTIVADSHCHHDDAPVSAHYSGHIAAHVAMSGEGLDAAGSSSRRVKPTVQRQPGKKGILYQKVSSIMKLNGSERK